jgi:hypothetical protein
MDHSGFSGADSDAGSGFAAASDAGSVVVHPDAPEVVWEIADRLREVDPSDVDEAEEGGEQEVSQMSARSADDVPAARSVRSRSFSGVLGTTPSTLNPMVEETTLSTARQTSRPHMLQRYYSGGSQEGSADIQIVGKEWDRQSPQQSVSLHDSMDEGMLSPLSQTTFASAGQRLAEQEDGARHEDDARDLGGDVEDEPRRGRARVKESTC